VTVRLFGAVVASAISAPEVVGNWMSTRIVARINEHKAGLVSPKNDDKRQHAVYGGVRYTSTGQFIDLTCCATEERTGCRHRFYIVCDEREDFDILLGSDMPHKSGSADKAPSTA
jgi:hypothetical protein